MIPFVVLGLGLGSGALVVNLFGSRPQSKLVDRLTACSPTAGDEPLDRPDDLLAALHYGLTQLDDQYQALIQTRLDPLLAGELRQEQMRQLAPEGQRELDPQEKAQNRLLLLGVGGLVLVVVRQISRWAPLTPVVLLIGFISVWPELRESWRVAVGERRFSLIHLLLIYLLGLWASGYYLVGMVGILLSCTGYKIELLTQSITRHSLTHLLGEQPSRVWVVVDGEERLIAFAELQLGDILVLTAGQSVPVDGVVMAGAAMVDQHRLTGESQPVEKAAGDPVLAATLVLGGKIQVRVEKTGAETTAARIGEVLNQTVEGQEVHLADQLRGIENERLPMIGSGMLGWLLGGPQTALAMLGCNFMISLPPLRLLTLLNGLGTGAERGVLIKEGRALERLAHVDTVVFDKTGTLTLEQQHVVAVHALAPFGEAELLTLAAAAEQRQSHPIAQAILAAASERQLALPDLDDAEVELGLGLRAQIEGQAVRIGSERFLDQNDLELPANLAKLQASAHARGHGMVFVAVTAAIAGAIELAAVSRPEALDTVAWLRLRGLSLYILSGDQEAPTASLAKELGMDGWFANTLPEQKANRIQALQEQGKRVCFIGDGINDAIALRTAEVSISLRGATTVATDAAQVVLMKDDLNQLKLLWELAWGFEESLGANGRWARQLGLLASAGVLLLPFGYGVTELLWGVQILVGVRIARRSLLHASDDEGELADAEGQIVQSESGREGEMNTLAAE
ncbi:MAG: heavy metal translocating P-type ATPase [Cyanobacteriota bacterium]